MAFTLDYFVIARGKYCSDYGLTAEQIRQARERANSLGIQILAVLDESITVNPDVLRAFGIVVPSN